MVVGCVVPTIFASTPNYLYPDMTYTEVIPNISVKLAANDIDLSWSPPIPENPSTPRSFPYFNPNCAPSKYKVINSNPSGCIIFSGSTSVCNPNPFDPLT